MKSSSLAAALATAYLLIYTILHALGAGSGLILFLFSLSPVVVLWMMFNILTDTSRDYRELEEGEEWGYADRVSGRK